MTGYLQRLALSAVTPAAIHPVRGSIFSPAEDPAASEVGEAEEQVLATSAAPATAATPQSPSAPRFPTNLTPVRPLSESAPMGDHSDRGVGEAEPALTHAESATARHGAVKTSAAQAATRARHEAADARDRDVAGRDRSAPPERPFVPLLEVQTDERTALPDHAERPRPAAASTAGRTGTDGKRQHPHPSPAERDEIEIHIGRIEVTAVQAAPPAPPTPRRHPPSLDDYLRRRNGGAR
jgi:hypothetical protein